MPEGVTKKVKNETTEQRNRLLELLVCTLESIVLGNLLSSKRIVRAGYGKEWDF